MPCRSSTHRPPVCWLVWGDRQFLLCAGEHVVGRDVGADVRLDASTVSRRHARLVVSGGRCNSKISGARMAPSGQ